jgi:hypothetical protein
LVSGDLRVCTGLSLCGIAQTNQSGAQILNTSIVSAFGEYQECGFYRVLAGCRI